jgi:hypothetical protein
VPLDAVSAQRLQHLPIAVGVQDVLYEVRGAGLTEPVLTGQPLHEAALEAHRFRFAALLYGQPVPYLSHVREQDAFDCAPDPRLCRVVEGAMGIPEVSEPLGDLPAAIQKVVGEGLRYREEGRFDKKSRHYGIRIVPSRLADKMSVDGELFTQAVGDNQVKRIFTAAVSVKIFGLGSMIEKRLVADLKRSYDVGAKFTADFIKEKGL